MNTRPGPSQSVFVARVDQRRCANETPEVWAAHAHERPHSGARRFPMRSQLRQTSWCVALLAALILISSGVGCGGARQGAAEKLIDPRLRERGVLVERQSPRGDLELGRYRVEQLRIDEQAFDGTGPLGPDAGGRTRPTQQWRLQFSLLGGAQPWEVECVGQRRQPPNHDLAATIDEPRDEVAAHCQLSSVERRWRLAIDGNLAANLSGRLEPLDPLDQRGDDARGKVVEIVMWHRLWNVSRRRLPASLALVRSGGETEAALILDTPERAWLAAELDDTGRELALASMLALRLLPLGFDT
jgi:hypothetical protein